MNQRTPWSPAHIYPGLFWFILMAAILIRLSYLGIERMWPDEALYAWCAQRIFEHPQLLFSKEVIGFHPPLFAGLLSLGHFFAPPETACRLITMLINVLGIVGIYLLGVRIKSQFLGCFAALVMAFNFLYLNQSIFILADGALAVVLIYFFMALTYVTPTPPCRKDIYVGLTACFVILTKWPGVLIIAFLAAYYLLAFSQWPLRNRLKKLSLPLGITVGLTMLLLINNHRVLGHWLPNTTAIQGAYLVKPFWYYAKGLANILIVPFLIPFFVIGLWIVFKQEHRTFLSTALWFVIFFTAISLTKEKDLRYSLPIFPQILLISGLGVEEAISRLAKDEVLRFKIQTVFLFLVAAFFIFTYPKTDRILKMVAQEFSGFREAGSFMKEEAAFDSNALVVAASPRIVRYYTGINFSEFGGRLIELPKTRNELAELVRQTDKPVILVLDAWEQTKRQWVLPLPNDANGFLTSLNFKQIKEVRRDQYLATKIVHEPVVTIWRRDP